jgi:hypothetical protein
LLTPTGLDISQSQQNTMVVMKRITFVSFCIVAVFSVAHAQDALSPSSGSSSATVGGTLGIQPLPARPTFGASGGNDIQRHRDFTGKPCLAVGGYARSRTLTPNLYDNVIVVVNGCPQRIALQVCYYQSQDCIPVEVPGGERKEAILGTLPASKDFRFEFREKF